MTRNKVSVRTIDRLRTKYVRTRALSSREVNLLFRYIHNLTAK